MRSSVLYTLSHNRDKLLSLLLYDVKSDDALHKLQFEPCGLVFSCLITVLLNRMSKVPMLVEWSGSSKFPEDLNPRWTETDPKNGQSP